MSDYKTDLQKTLVAAQKRLRQGREMKALKAGAPSLFKIIDGEISMAVTRAFADKPLDYEAYLSAHGEVKMAKRIRNIVDSKAVEEGTAAEEVKQIQKNLEQIDNDQAKQ